jgi:hypothetical protein
MALSPANAAAARANAATIMATLFIVHLLFSRR